MVHGKMGRALTYLKQSRKSLATCLLSPKIWVKSMMR
jgi:hypothetical protein